MSYKHKPYQQNRHWNQKNNNTYQQSDSSLATQNPEENKPKLGKKIGMDQDSSFPRRMQVDKPVWAAYANMARQNIYQTLCHISHVIGQDVDKNDTKMEENLLGIPAVKILTQKGKAEIKAKAIKMLESHFPFLEPMVEKLVQLNVNEQQKKAEKQDAGKNKNQKKNKQSNFIGDKTKTPEMYYEVFNCILPLINLLRNYYSHSILIDNRISHEGKILDEKYQAKSQKLVTLLDHCMTGARRIVKDRFSVAENITFTKKDFEFFEGKNRYFDYTIVNEDGFAILDDRNREQKIKREKRNYIYKVGIREENDRYTSLSNMGIYLFLCLFLSKKYAKEFGDKIDFWGNKLKYKPSENVMAIMHETASVFRMNLPKNRLQSKKDQSAVGLDMLNELKKCPKELFETLSAKDQDKFRVAVKDSEEETGSTVLLLRSFDRFPTLALQYLDSMQKFNHIRFQVDLGNYRFKFYEKKNWIDRADEESAGRVRILQKELTGYGRLDEIEKQRKERWSGLIREIDQARADSFDSKPYITDHHASYHLEGNHIGMQWNTRSRGILDNSGIFMPSTDLSDKKEDSAKKTVAPLCAPKCRLSIHDLPVVCFLTLLSETDKENHAENLIIETTENFQRFFHDIAEGIVTPEIIPQNIKEEYKAARAKAREKKGMIEGQTYSYVIEPYCVDLADLPRKIQDFLLEDETDSKGNDRFKELARLKLKNMIEYTDKKLKQIKKNRGAYASKDNKLGKKSHVDIRQGTLARFLAKDMVFFKKPDDNGRIMLTSQNFDILQKELALFNKPILDLSQLFANAELIGCNNSADNHPFLQAVIDSKPKDFLGFYICYLERRKEYLEKLLKLEDLSGLHFLHSQRAKWAERDEDYYKKLVGEYKTIDLPHNLFLNAIVEKLQKIAPTLENPQILLDALAQERKNTAFLINAYMLAKGDGCQPFYDYRRSYKYFAMTKEPDWDVSGPTPKLIERYLTVAEMKEFVKDNDKGKLEKTYKDSLLNRKAALIQKAEARNKTANEYKLSEEVNTMTSEAHDKLSLSLKFYKENEKEIRRVKVQDAVLYLMAKDVLTHTMNNADLSAYKLKYIGKDSETDILSMQLPFAVRLQFRTSDDSTKEVTIRQADLKLKNYGDFFRFIYDSRIQPLLAQVDAMEIDRSQLEQELDNYDQKRIPLFKYVHELERRICETLSEEQFHKDAEGNPVKVDFKYLLEYLNTNENTKDLLKAIRNAFCHGTYPDGSRVALVFEKEEGKREIPNVANALAESFESRSKSATTKQKKVKK